MNDRMDKLAQWAPDESRCGFCGRRWFGLVVYCPYCGRESGFTTAHQEPDLPSHSDEALATEAATLGVPAGKLSSQDPEPPPELPREEPRETPLQDAPVAQSERLEDLVPGQDLLFGPDKAAASKSNTRASTLLYKTAVAGVSALLLVWMGLKLLAPKTNEGASAQVPISASGIAPATRAASTSAPQVPPSSVRTETAVPQPSNRSLCSAANEAAGLCKSQ